MIVTFYVLDRVSSLSLLARGTSNHLDKDRFVSLQLLLFKVLDESISFFLTLADDLLELVCFLLFVLLLVKVRLCLFPLLGRDVYHLI